MHVRIRMNAGRQLNFCIKLSHMVNSTLFTAPRLVVVKKFLRFRAYTSPDAVKESTNSFILSM